MPGDDYFNQLNAHIESAKAARGEPRLLRIRDVLDFAKAEGDNDTAAEFSRHLIKAANLQARIDYEMIGFGELRALYERNPNFADLRDQVLWYYKWLAEHLPEHVEVPRAQIDAFLDQMEQTYRDEKAGLRPVHEHRCRAAAFMGRRDEAEAHYELWQATPSDQSDDCPACETHAKAHALLSLGRLEEAIDAAEPILAGEQHCEEVPATTFSILLFPLLITGKLEQAVVLHSAVRRQVRHVPKLVGYLADHVLFLSVIGALHVAARHNLIMLARIEDVPNTAYQFAVARAAWVHFARQQKAGRTVADHPRRSDLSPIGEPVPIDRAIAFYQSKARALATAFDARNGTARFADRTTLAERLVDAAA